MPMTLPQSRSDATRCLSPLLPSAAPGDRVVVRIQGAHGHGEGGNGAMQAQPQTRSHSEEGSAGAASVG